MARRQIYDHVMDVALRNTLKKCGFTRKTRRDYILERPDRIWIFELEMAPDPRAGFETMAAVCLPQFDEIFETHLPDFWRQRIASRNHAHVGTSIEKLMEIASGHDFYTMQRGPASRNWSEAYQKAQSDPVMQYQDHGYWVPPKYGDHLEQSHEQDMRDWKRGVRELGLFIDEQWRTHVWEWYWRCNDPLYVVDWIEEHEHTSSGTDISLAVLCHMAGDDRRAASYLERRIQDTRETRDEIYRKLYKAYRGNWLRRLWSGGWSEKRVAAETDDWLDGAAMLADAARKMADGLGIRLDMD